MIEGRAPWCLRETMRGKAMECESVTFQDRLSGGSIDDRLNEGELRRSVGLSWCTTSHVVFPWDCRATALRHLCFPSFFRLSILTPFASAFASGCGAGGSARKKPPLPTSTRLLFVSRLKCSLTERAEILLNKLACVVCTASTCSIFVRMRVPREARSHAGTE